MKKCIFLTLLALVGLSAYAMQQKFDCESGHLYSHSNSYGTYTWVWTDGVTTIVGDSSAVGAGHGC
jgi:hypothetical protein